MKRILITVIMLLFSFSAYADLATMYGTVKKKITTETTETGPANGSVNRACVCPPCAATPFSDVTRADVDVEARFHVLDNPGDGRYDLYFPENWEIAALFNFNAGFFAYTSYGVRQFQINQASDAIYAQKWESSYIMVGAGIYAPSPVFKIYGGGGRFIKLEDHEGKAPEGLGYLVEYGISYDIAYNNNKIVIGTEMVQVSLDEGDSTAAENDGNPSHISFYVAFSFGLMR